MLIFSSRSESSESTFFQVLSHFPKNFTRSTQYPILTFPTQSLCFSNIDRFDKFGLDPFDTSDVSNGFCEVDLSCGNHKVI